MDEQLFIRYRSFLEKVLTPIRLQHSLGVMQLMEALAIVYGLEPEQAASAGLLHDAGKDLPPAQQQQLIDEANLGIEPGDLYYSLYTHGPVGACFARKALGITDALILDAIHMHAFCGEGRNFHAPFVWCLRFADLLDPNRCLSDPRWTLERQWFQDGRTRLWDLVFAGNLREAALFHTASLIEMFEEKGLPVHPNMRQAFSTSFLFTAAPRLRRDRLRRRFRAGSGL